MGQNAGSGLGQLTNPDTGVIFARIQVACTTEEVTSLDQCPVVIDRERDTTFQLVCQCFPGYRKRGCCPRT